MKIRASISISAAEKTTKYSNVFDSEKHNDQVLIEAISQFKLWVQKIAEEYPDLNFQEQDLRSFLEG